jgi:hypothetical protein
MMPLTAQAVKIPGALGQAARLENCFGKVDHDNLVSIDADRRALADRKKRLAIQA